jgi:hypothetical protein
MAKDYLEKRSNFADRLKNTPTNLPIQEVTPVRPQPQVQTKPPAVEEIQINAWIPKDLMKRLKTKGLEDDKSLKNCIIEALENYVN